MGVCPSQISPKRTTAPLVTNNWKPHSFDRNPCCPYPTYHQPRRPLVVAYIHTHKLQGPLGLARWSSVCLPVSHLVFHVPQLRSLGGRERESLPTVGPWHLGRICSRPCLTNGSWLGWMLACLLDISDAKLCTDTAVGKQASLWKGRKRRPGPGCVDVQCSTTPRLPTMQASFFLFTRWV